MPGYLDTKQPRDVAAAPAVRVSGKPGGCPLGTSRSPRPFRRERLTRRASNVEWIRQVARCESSWRVWAGLYCLRRALVGDFGCVDPP